MSSELTSRERERIRFTAIALAKRRFAHDGKPEASVVSHGPAAVLPPSRPAVFRRHLKTAEGFQKI
ncbi:hypothetical protein EYF80_050606 [Liparis tanakae]|uniref:Uncharacterized protein n=1 Tax=Liparis tanakae TaxID=230148 RepID=A0A4Z2FFN3_9TELE|nr:hypothetical protein EYF80_050606 [Liparis tanakae]